MAYWLYRQDLAGQNGEVRSLLTAVQDAVTQQDPQLTALPGHDHGGIFCYRWADCFIFTPESVMAERIRSALEDEAWLTEKATAA